MEIDLEKLPFDLDFHPSTNLITGDLLLYRYAAEATLQRLLEVNAHTESCRALRFVNEGRAIVTGSPDFSILATDVETGAPISCLDNSHEAAVSRIVNLTESTIASGDDEGCIKIKNSAPNSSLFETSSEGSLAIDVLLLDSLSVSVIECIVESLFIGMGYQASTCCNTLQVHKDYISDMTFASDSMKLTGTSGDGRLSVCNLRSNKVQTRSEFSEDELLSVVIMKNGRKVVCGTQTGTLLLYSWGFFMDCRLILIIVFVMISDRFVDLSPNSVDAMLKLWDLDELLQGSETTMPNRSAASDSDSDGMDVDASIPKPSKGTKRKNVSKGSKLDNSPISLQKCRIAGFCDNLFQQIFSFIFFCGFKLS
ncbi:hypothetical protein SASPL_118463 [Salvia splendens]|uniref:WD repeat-containing protein 55 n=1 Tax=Salvia splendens TaxID=180675 RepID=A0A8X8ZYQ7_SALSN|nr:hypothetical protein SASPL_118463 [Salvia splendens]